MADYGLRQEVLALLIPVGNIIAYAGLVSIILSYWIYEKTSKKN
jgi:hypothetical protein